MLPDTTDVLEAAIGSVVATLTVAVVLGLMGFTSTSEISASIKGDSNNTFSA